MPTTGDGLPHSSASASQAQRLLLDSIDAACCAWDAGGAVVFCNRAFREHVGVAAVGASFGAVFDGDRFREYRAAVDAALRGTATSFAIEHTDAFGRLRHMSGSCAVDRDDREGGRIVGVTMLVRDETTVREAARLHLQEQATLLTILENLPSCTVFAFDEAQRIVRMMGPCERRAHWNGCNVIGELASVGGRAELERCAARCLRGERVEHELAAHDRHYHVSFVPLVVEGGRSGLFVAYETTERDELRLRLMRQGRLVTIGTLAAGVGHEINNPLAYVVASLELALRELDGGVLTADGAIELRDLLKDAAQGAERIRAIVRGLSALVREEKVVKPIDVREPVQVAVRMAQHEVLGRATVELELEAAPLVAAEDSSLTQVIINLVMNAAQAFEASDPHRNRIVVRTGTTERGKAFIEVSDNGPGVPDEIAGRVFDPFFTTQPPGLGTGLGLSICHGIVTDFHGDIVLKKAATGGAAFRVELPPTLPVNEGNAPGPNPAAVPVRGHLLLIDDDEGVLTVLRRIFSPHHDICALSDAREARGRLLAGEQFDVVLCDVMMPHVDGLQIYRDVLAVDPDQASRFVFVTGGGLSEELAAVLQGLDTPALEKPFTVGHVTRVVTSILLGNDPRVQ